MPTLSENPHLSDLLLKNGLEIVTNISLWTSLDPQFKTSIKVGDITNSGTVVGFAIKGKNRKNLFVVIYDESKEGQDAALSTIDLTPKNPKRSH